MVLKNKNYITFFLTNFSKKISLLFPSISPIPRFFKICRKQELLKFKNFLHPRNRKKKFSISPEDFLRNKMVTKINFRTYFQKFLSFLPNTGFSANSKVEHQFGFISANTSRESKLFFDFGLLRILANLKSN